MLSFTKLYTVCPRSIDPIYLVSYYVKLVKTCPDNSEEILYLLIFSVTNCIFISAKSMVKGSKGESSNDPKVLSKVFITGSIFRWYSAKKASANWLDSCKVMCENSNVNILNEANMVCPAKLLEIGEEVRA